MNSTFVGNQGTPGHRVDIVSLQNPFLDPFSTPQGATTALPGQPLSRIQIPPIRTLVRKTIDSTGSLTMVNVGEALNRAGITPRETVLVRDETIGIELNLSLFGTAIQEQTPSEVTPSEIQTGQVVGRRIPTNYREARDVLHLIVAQRTGSRNEAFNINQLKMIAKNLNIQSTGNKDVLANRIRTSIIEFYNLSQ